MGYMSDYTPEGAGTTCSTWAVTMRWRWNLFDALAVARHTPGVLGFGLPVRGDADRLYCFEVVRAGDGGRAPALDDARKLLLAAGDAHDLADHFPPPCGR